MITYSPAKERYIISKKYGLTKVFSDDGDSLNDGEEIAEDIEEIKIVRTPISCRTFIIGGIHCKAIRELTTMGMDAVIRPLVKSYKFTANLKYNLFTCVSRAYSLVPQDSEDKKSSREEWDKLYTYVSKISEKKWVREWLNNFNFTKRVNSAFQKIISELNESNVKELVEFIRSEVTVASYTLMKDADGADLLAASEVFTESSLVSV